MNQMDCIIESKRQNLPVAGLYWNPWALSLESNQGHIDVRQEAFTGSATVLLMDRSLLTDNSNLLHQMQFSLKKTHLHVIEYNLLLGAWKYFVIFYR